MTTLNQGRNEIRFNNSSGKCLLENWVEERAVQNIDPAELNGEQTSSAQLYKDGHQGLLTTNFAHKAQDVTEFRENYKPPKGPGVRTKGSKQELLEEMYYRKVSQEVHEEFNPPPPAVDYNSVTAKDFNQPDFVPSKPAPTQHHDYMTDQPVTFWSEHRDKIHGHSQVKARDTVFRKNSSFSKPVEEYWNQPMPYEQELVPKM